MADKEIKFMIAAGGTGGHVFPGIAVAEALSSLMSRDCIVFVGTSNGPEAKLVPQAGWPMIFIGASSTHGGGFKNRALSYLRVPRALISAWCILKRERPSMVIGTGGFAAGPVVLAAALKGIPTAIIEPNAVAGRANLRLAKFVKRIFVGFDAVAGSFPAGKTTVTGNPVRRSIAAVERRAFDPKGVLTVLCYGGSQGAKRINEVMMGAAAKLVAYCERIRFIHQVGKSGNVKEVANAYRRAGFEAEVFEFSHRMADLYGEADIAVARSGAGTVAELAAVRLPSVLVPYPHAVDDHQEANALELERMGGALVVNESNLSAEGMAETLKGFVDQPGKLQAMQDALSKASWGDAARKIAEECTRMVSDVQ
jgi:UDP-N-acetylglucosamine--N-acetylmuramyl-(pentapeptide) pyrophosphoryl-undecaprenol N-acetylglucosamine transferase